jgi:hypothetical protein
MAAGCGGAHRCGHAGFRHFVPSDQEFIGTKWRAARFPGHVTGD